MAGNELGCGGHLGMNRNMAVDNRDVEARLPSSQKSGLAVGNTVSSTHTSPIEPPISDEIFKSGPKLGSYKVGDSTFYSLIENYANSGEFASLEMVFDRMKRERRVFIEKSFILVFKSYGKSHLPEKAVDLFYRMLGEFQCRPTVRSFNSVLNVIFQVRLYSCALEFHWDVVVGTKKISPNVLTFNLVIKAMCRLGLIDRAIEVFREMPVWNCAPDVFTYCTLMDGLCKENRIDEAVLLLDEMQTEGCFPGKLDKAISLLDSMVLYKCVPNDVTYGTIINGLVKQGRAVDGGRAMISMEERGHHANEYVFSILISGLFKEGKSEEAMRLWKEMSEKGCKPNTVVYSALIDGFCREGKPDDAKEILSEMLTKGFMPNAFTYSSLMRGFFKTGNSHKAILVWKEMANNKCMHNEVCYSVLINGFYEDGNLEEAIMVWKQMLA
ncbi:hypothetical protein HYC85_018744 [Camellia sinensis]|uniref:Pentacotripeptide-repeat region of PRORP domain-containing protein n=1 Tax=Camellia sinensis TaxID=4442 RepID=A0A7J7GW38_CAMSI|nr:hypothetical protein HYC85_018744 [Camellia sinensis]